MFTIQRFVVCFILLIGMSVLVVSQTGTQPEKPLRNQDIIDLVKLRLSSEVIISKIAGSSAQFDLSLDGLKVLAENQVPNDIIAAMQAKVEGTPVRQGADQKGNPSTQPDSSSTRRDLPYPLPPEKGAYLWDGEALHLLYLSSVPSTGDNVVRRYIPFAKKKLELQLIGAKAKAQFQTSQPVILVSGLDEVIPGISSYRWLYVKPGGMLKDRRIIGTYDTSYFFRSTNRVDNEVDCQTTKVAEGVYAITPVKPLSSGEYGLLYVPKASESRSAPSAAPPIWDFGINSNSSGQ